MIDGSFIKALFDMIYMYFTDDTFLRTFDRFLYIARATIFIIIFISGIHIIATKMGVINKHQKYTVLGFTAYAGFYLYLDSEWVEISNLVPAFVDFQWGLLELYLGIVLLYLVSSIYQEISLDNLIKESF